MEDGDRGEVALRYRLFSLRHPWLLGVLAFVPAPLLAVIAIPQLLLGPGTDLDVGAVLASGRLIMHGDYRPSRPPGIGGQPLSRFAGEAEE